MPNISSQLNDINDVISNENFIEDIKEVNKSITQKINQFEIDMKDKNTEVQENLDNAG